jgi:hypothetical protein
MQVGDSLQQAIELGAGGVIVHASGFAETGLSERVVEQEKIVATARRSAIRLAGPNCVGLANMRSGALMNFMPDCGSMMKGPSGRVAVISQSGALGNVLQSMVRGVGVSHYLAGGNSSALGVDERRFLKPIFFGDTVHLRATMVSARPTSKPDRGVLVRRMGLVNQHGAVVQTGGIAVLGRLTLGSGIDRIDVRMASAAAFCVRGGTLVLMASCPGWPTGLFLGVVLFGMNIGNVATFPAFIIGREFDAAIFMRFLGLCTAIGEANYAFGPILIGLLRDTWPGIRPGWPSAPAFPSWRR